MICADLVYCAVWMMDHPPRGGRWSDPATSGSCFCKLILTWNMTSIAAFSWFII